MNSRMPRPVHTHLGRRGGVRHAAAVVLRLFGQSMVESMDHDEAEAVEQDREGSSTGSA